MIDNNSENKTSEKRHVLTLDERAEKALAALEGKIQEKDRVKSGRDRKLLEKIGTDKLKHIVLKMKLSEVFRVLKKNGFRGDKALLADILDDMGVREKQEAPEKLKKVKCKVDGCDGVLQECEGENGEKLSVCLLCGRVHRKEGRKWAACENHASKEELQALGGGVKEEPKKEVVKPSHAVPQGLSQGSAVASTLKDVFASTEKPLIERSREARAAKQPAAAPRVVVDEGQKTGMIIGDDD